ESDVHTVVDKNAGKRRTGTNGLKRRASEFQTFAAAQIFFPELDPIHAGGSDGFDGAEKHGHGVRRESERKAAPVGDVAEDGLRQRGEEGHWRNLSWVESC